MKVKLLLYLVLCWIGVACSNRPSCHIESNIIVDGQNNDTAIEELIQLQERLGALKQHPSHTYEVEMYDSIFNLLKAISTNIEEQNDTILLVSFIELYDNYPFNAIEISEFTNEILFSLMQRKTNLLLSLISTHATMSQYESIISELRIPICDTLNIDIIEDKVKKTNVAEKTKLDVLNALKVAKIQ